MKTLQTLLNLFCMFIYNELLLICYETGALDRGLRFFLDCLFVCLTYIDESFSVTYFSWHLPLSMEVPSTLKGLCFLCNLSAYLYTQNIAGLFIQIKKLSLEKKIFAICVCKSADLNFGPFIIV